MRQSNEITRLRRENIKLRQALAQRPVKPPKGSSAVRWHVEIIDGQTAYSVGATTYYGLLKSASAITEVPSVYDPNAFAATPGLFTAITGIGRGKLYVNGVSQSGFVLVAHYASSPNLITYGILNGEFVESESTVTIPLTGDPTQSVTCYLPLFM